MPRREDVIRLHHMLEASRDALSFISGKARRDLDDNKMLRLSLVRCIEIIGEAASRLSPDCQSEFPAIPWKNIINMRNRLIHAYYDINIDTVWGTVTEDLPPLITELEKIVTLAEKP
ncbi:MAG: DUF86 domain-containing protein [Deltaproteobacteria bacterium]|nr:DUF86 domain-containing protein [Deltaproteobacteria bacterium]